ncbi:uncharacterized protein CEXT_426451 [Caerostris extrusa]|uniref:Uncharacterized protein n=1 Tax=Caerostris extrusa TaxID=172846 RepID=A0AAV4Y5E7_CAEEX|nr:uncharacterized protein CEXT_426451 [Caerostris extrusa]
MPLASVGSNKNEGSVSSPENKARIFLAARTLQCRPPHGAPPLLPALHGVQLPGRHGHLPHLPLRGGRRAAPHQPLLLRRLAALRAPGLPAAVDQELRHPLLRALQVPLHHALQDQALQEVGEAGDVAGGAAQGSLFHHVPRGGHNVRGVVPVRADRPHGRGDALGGAGVAVLDQADRGGHRLHGGTRLHVRAVQDVRAAVQAVARLQPHHLRAERAGEVRQPAAAGGLLCGRAHGGGAGQERGEALLARGGGVPQLQDQQLGQRGQRAGMRRAGRRGRPAPPARRGDGLHQDHPHLGDGQRPGQRRPSPGPPPQ